MTRKDGRWSLSTRTTCPICGEKIGRGSYSCPGPSFTPVHMRCYLGAEMAVTDGAHIGTPALSGGSSSPPTPEAGDATQAPKDGQSGSPTDRRPPHNSPFSDAMMEEIQGDRDRNHPEMDSTGWEARG